VQCKGAVGDFGCNDFWDNEYGHVGCPPGPTDFSADPRFCNRLGGDYSLLAGSPCAPPQSPPGCGLIGAFDVGCTPLEVPDVANTGLVPLRMAVDPHPILGRTTIRLDLADTMPVAIVLFDAQGRTLRRLLAGERTAGHHAVEWDGLDSRGQRAAPGIYFLRVEAGGTTVSRKLVVLDR
jgi:hypothetical protein